MGDLVDEGNENAARGLESAIAKVRHDATKTLEPTGECYTCGQDVAEGRRFCDVGCRDDWDKRQRLEKLRGSK